MKKVLARLETEPVITKAKHPQTGMEFEVAISKLDLQLVTSFFMLKNPGNSKDLPLIYHQLEKGDFSRVAPWVAGVKMYVGRMSAMSFAMDAMSGISTERWRKIQEEAQTALLGRTTNFPFPDVIEGTGLPDLGENFRKNPVSSIPSLFFSGTLDGRTYLPSAKELIKGFDNGIHVVIDGAGHDLFLSTPKVKDLLLGFFGEKVRRLFRRRGRGRGYFISKRTPLDIGDCHGPTGRICGCRIIKPNRKGHSCQSRVQIWSIH